MGGKLKNLSVYLIFPSVSCIDKCYLKGKSDHWLCKMEVLWFEMLLFYACDLQHLQGYVDVGGCLHSREDFFPLTRQQAWPLLVPVKTIITPSIIFQFLLIQGLFHHGNLPPSSRQGSYRAFKSRSNSSHCFPWIPCSPLWIADVFIRLFVAFSSDSIFVTEIHTQLLASPPPFPVKPDARTQ